MNGGHFVDPIIHWTIWLWHSIMVSTVSWVMKLCTRPVVLTLTFSWPFCKVTKNLEFFAHCTMNGGHFVDPIIHWTIWLWHSIMVSTVSWDDEVVHKTCCFDLDLFLQYHKKNLEFSMMVSTVSNDDVVVHNIYCFDLDLSLIFWKVTNNLDSFPFLQWLLD